MVKWIVTSGEAIQFETIGLRAFPGRLKINAFIKKKKHKDPRRIKTTHFSDLTITTASMTEMLRENNTTNLVSLNRWLGSRLLLFSLHNEVMKQQVWAARSAWVDKPPKESVAAQRTPTRPSQTIYLNAKERKKKRPNTGSHGFWHSTTLLVSSLSAPAREKKKVANSPPTKQASEEIPVCSVFLLFVAIQQRERIHSSGRGSYPSSAKWLAGSPPSALYYMKIRLTRLIHSSRARV